MVHTYRTREEPEPPKWMENLLSAPAILVQTRLPVDGFFPTDIFTSVAVGSYLAAQGAPWTDSLPFTGDILLFLALPSLLLLAFGKRGEAILPTAHDWMEPDRDRQRSRDRLFHRHDDQRSRGMTRSRTVRPMPTLIDRFRYARTDSSPIREETGLRAITVRG